jgi:hypothetical protein
MYTGSCVVVQAQWISQSSWVDSVRSAVKEDGKKSYGVSGLDEVDIPVNVAKAANLSRPTFLQLLSRCTT